jgi:hypothetical protein
MEANRGRRQSPRRTSNLICEGHRAHSLHHFEFHSVRLFPSFGHGVNAASLDPPQQGLRETICCGFFTSVTRLWTVLDGSCTYSS